MIRFLGTIEEKEGETWLKAEREVATGTREEEKVWDEGVLPMVDDYQLTFRFEE